MKNTVTIAISVPETLAKDIDKMKGDMNISRSAFLTVLLTVLMNWIKTATAEDMKKMLNSLYGKKG